MKRLLAATICVFLLFSSYAYAQGPYDAWVLKVTDIAVSRNGQTVRLQPTLQVYFGVNENFDFAWLQLEGCLDGESLAAYQYEYEQGMLRISAIGARDCAFYNDGDHLLLLYSMMIGFEPGIDAKTIFSLLRSMLESTEVAEGIMKSLIEMGISANRVSDTAYEMQMTLDDYGIQCKLQWMRDEEMTGPFDFTGKNMVQYAPSRGLSDTDILETLMIGTKQLLADKTVAELIRLMEAEALLEN